jgi:hypothetical protein
VTLRHRGRPAERALAPRRPQPPPQIVVQPATLWTRLRGWWRRYFRVAEEVGRGHSEAPPVPPKLKIGHDVIAMASSYRCGQCGGELLFEPIDTALTFATQRSAVAHCINLKCRLVDVRLRVPMTVLPKCELETK